MKGFLKIVFVVVATFMFMPNLSAQLRGVGGFLGSNPAGTMQNNTSQTDTLGYDNDTTKYAPSFTLKRYFKALSHKDSMKISHMFFGAMVLPGTGQIYNNQKWKLPIIYGALGGCIGGAVATGQKNLRTGLVLGAVAVYWGQLADATINYKSPDPHLPGRASFYSALLPGLGQAYNGDYWHIPFYYAGFMVSGYCWAFNQKQYKRYKQMYIDAYNGTYGGSLTQENISWYRDQYRRNRDYSVVATILIYVLNVIDANVFAHFTNFDVSDDISFNVQPSVVQPIIPVGGLYGSSLSEGKLGLQMNIRF